MDTTKDISKKAQHYIGNL